MATPRKRTNRRLALVQGLPALGAAVGLVITDGPGARPGCGGDTADCVGQSLWSGARPYLEHALGGALVGLAVVMVLVLVWNARAGSARPAAAAKRQPIPQRIRHEVWRRDRGTCVECGSRGRLEFDHIIPVSRGGSNTTRNIELRCEPCNRRKGARI
jgi:hypothetical protein